MHMFVKAVFKKPTIGVIKIGKSIRLRGESVCAYVCEHKSGWGAGGERHARSALTSI